MVLFLPGVLSLGLMTLARPPVIATSGPVYYIDHPLARVFPDAAVPPGAAVAIEVSAAANEFEGVHIVFHGGNTGLHDVRIELPAPLVSESGHSIPGEAVRFYREHYAGVTSPSTSRGRAGSYPDALIPFLNPFDGSAVGTTAYPATPFDVAPGRSQPVYVEFFVPPDTPGGSYRGRFRVLREPGVVFAEIPVLCKVWGFVLPTAPSLRTAFQSFDADHSLGPARYMGYVEKSPQHRALATAIDEMLIGHRLTPENPLGTSLGASRDGTVVTTTDTAARLLSYLKRSQYTNYQLPFGNGFPFRAPTTTNRAVALNYLRTAYRWFESHGVVDKVFLRPGDEPASTADFVAIADFAALIREANPGYTVAMTVNIADPRVTTYLSNHVNRLVAGYWSFDPKEAAAKQAAGIELWSYTALAQNIGNPSPYWLIDFPLQNFRVVPWINFRYGITGLLYWTTALWGELADRHSSPWVDPCSFRSGGTCFNGDGMLLYPGLEAGLVVPQYAFGSGSPAPVFGPIASLRLKTLRDAMEDYEYLVMAYSADPAAAMREAIEVGCAGSATANCFHQWNQDAPALFQARSRLAGIIEAAQSRRSPESGQNPRGPAVGTPRVGRGR